MFAYKPRVLAHEIPGHKHCIRDINARPNKDAQVAQLVEQRTENPRVGGSIPPLGTTSYQPIM